MPYELGDDDRASSSSMSGSESDKSDGSSSAVSRQNTPEYKGNRRLDQLDRSIESPGT